MKSHHVDSYSFFFLRRRRRRFLPIFFFVFYFYYYKIMIMTIMIMKTIMIVFNSKQNANPKIKCAYMHTALCVVDLFSRNLSP